MGSVLLRPERVSGTCGRRTLSDTASEPHGVTEAPAADPGWTSRRLTGLSEADSLPLLALRHLHKLSVAGAWSSRLPSSAGVSPFLTDSESRPSAAMPAASSHKGAEALVGA